MKTVVRIGGIGSGKSTVSSMFAQLGAGVISLDDIGHFVLTTPEVKFDLARTFGTKIFDEKGEVVRSRLAKEAFDCPEHTEWLNGITHPAIWKECFRRVDILGEIHPMVIVEVTSGPMSREEFAWADAIMTVSAPEDVRVARAVARGQSEGDVRSRLAMQLTDAQREAISDYIIRSDGTLEDVRRQVEAIWESVVGSDGAC